LLRVDLSHGKNLAMATYRQSDLRVN
jgi:hypothetical protein